jgi:hypothetical protein
LVLRSSLILALRFSLILALRSSLILALRSSLILALRSRGTPRGTLPVIPHPAGIDHRNADAMEALGRLAARMALREEPLAFPVAPAIMSRNQDLRGSVFTQG